MSKFFLTLLFTSVSAFAEGFTPQDFKPWMAYFSDAGNFNITKEGIGKSNGVDTKCHMINAQTPDNKIYLTMITNAAQDNKQGFHFFQDTGSDLKVEIENGVLTLSQTHLYENESVDLGDGWAEVDAAFLNCKGSYRSAKITSKAIFSSKISRITFSSKTFCELDNGQNVKYSEVNYCQF